MKLKGERQERTGQPKSNHLQGESSPYLKQHVYNLVDWYPWSEEAFEKAKKENKPIFLSVGYSTCHWCHVMAHESFEDPKTAEYLNDYFISIKVDREERPDLDQFYQRVIQLTGKSGGWPLSIFMTYDKKPFFAGTYFPNSRRYGMISFMDLLNRIHELYITDYNKLVESAENIVQTIEKYSDVYETVDVDGILTEKSLIKVAKDLENKFDLQNGGFGSAPKFPNFPTLLFALRQVAEYNVKEPEKFEKLKKLLLFSLRKMAEGGIYDHIGGGFSRYSVDAHWLVPHFEKMLYDNAMVLQVYSEAYKIFKYPRFKKIVRKTVDWLIRIMYTGETGFYSAMDADSEGEEGKYYVWNKKELDEILKRKNKQLFYQAYGVTSAGNFEHGMTVLNRFKSNEALANEFNLSEEQVITELEDMRTKVFDARKHRIKPSIDTKILTSWNSLLISGLYTAYSIFNDEKIKNIAHGTVEFIKNSLYDPERHLLYEVYDSGGETRKNIGNLDTYAYFIRALYDDFTYTQDLEILMLIGKLLKSVNEQFQDKDKGGFFFSSNQKDDILVRMKQGADMPLLNPNAVMAENFLRYHYLTAEQKYYRSAESTMALYLKKALIHPTAFGAFLITGQWYIYGSSDIACLYKADEDRDQFLSFIREYYIPRIYLLISNQTVSNFAMFEDKKSVMGENRYYFCHRFYCRPPITDFDTLKEEITKVFVHVD